MIGPLKPGQRRPAPWPQNPFALTLEIDFESAEVIDGPEAVMSFLRDNGTSCEEAGLSDWPATQGIYEVKTSFWFEEAHWCGIEWAEDEWGFEVSSTRRIDS